MSTDRLVMPPVVDLLSFMSKLFWHGRTKGSIEVRMALRVLDENIIPIDVGVTGTPDVVWRDAGILWLEFLNEKDILSKIEKVKLQAVRTDLEQFFNSCSQTVVPYGMLHVALSRNTALASKDILVTGRLHCGVSPEHFTNMYVCSIAPPAQNYAVIPCKQVFELSRASKDAAQYALYQNIVHDGGMRFIMPKLTTSAERDTIPRICIDTLDAKTVSSSSLLAPIYYEWDVAVDTKLCVNFRRLNASGDMSSIVATTKALNNVKETSNLEFNGMTAAQPNNAVVSEETVSYNQGNAVNVSDYSVQPVVNNLQKGIEVKNGRIYYNRHEFYENTAFINNLDALLTVAKNKVDAKVAELSSFAVDTNTWQNFCALNKIPLSSKVDGERFYHKQAENVLYRMWNIFVSNIGGPKSLWKHKAVLDVDGAIYKGSTGFILCRELLERAFDWDLLSVDSSKTRQTSVEVITDLVQGMLENSRLGSVLSTLTSNAGTPPQGTQTKSKNTSLTVTAAMAQLSDSLKLSPDVWVMCLASVIFDIKYDFGKYMLPDTEDEDVKIEDILAWMGRNPYDLVFVLGDIKIRDLDRLAMIMGVFENTDYEASRAVAYLHSVLLNDNNMNIRGKTAVPLKSIYKWFVYGFNVTVVDARRMINDTIAVPCNVFINALSFGGFSRQNFVQTAKRVQSLNGDVAVLFKRSYNTKDAIEAYINSGYGIVVENIKGLPECLCDYNLLSAEYDIYKKCKKINDYRHNETINTAEIEQYIGEFERKKAAELHIPDFKLEAKQREAVMQLNNNIMALYGSAGTGKTTTAEVLLYVMQKALDIQDEEILFIAPTGKAATRLREVVKRPTSTIHRAIKLGKGCSKARAGILEAKVIIVDESSMITVNLMHNLMNCISASTRVYFLGDIAQLLAIGFGKPFANMLNYIPVTTLEVGKRAKENSSITKCANAWLSVTEPNPLQEGSDLKIVGMSANEVSNYIFDICKHYLSKNAVPLPQGVAHIDIPNLKPEDIQVVSPIKAAKREYSTANLNTKLRDLFNPFNGSATRLFWTVGDTQYEFRVGDRVINTQNNANAVRYFEENGEYWAYDPEESAGVMNGDVGIIRDIVDGVDMKFGTDTAVKRSSKRRQSNAYILVDYVDVDLANNKPMTYTIAYEVFKDSNYIGTIGCIYVTAAAIGTTSLELAYALTVHKMEGSEAKLVIFPCYSMGTSDFMSNNLIYTAMTRARKGLYMLGDVTNSTIMSQMQHCTLIDKRLSVFDVY